jgi:hypothetical protein
MRKPPVTNSDTKGCPERARIQREKFAELAGCDLSTVDKAFQKAIDKLERAGLIERRLRGRANEYRALRS